MTRNNRRRGKKGRIPQARRGIPELSGILAGLSKVTLMMVSIIYLRTTYSSVYLMYSIDRDGERFYCEYYTFEVLYRLLLYIVFTHVILAEVQRDSVF